MKICIVGNGYGVTKNKNGNFIDNCDIVIRIKNFQISGFEENVGTKTDMYSSKWFSWFDRKTLQPLKFDFINNVRGNMFMFPNEEISLSGVVYSEYTYLYTKLQLRNELVSPYKNWEDHKTLLTYFGIEDKELIYFSPMDIEELCINILKLDRLEYKIQRKNLPDKIIEPTCGIRTIYKILQLYKNDEIFITGFDCFMTSWYWEPTHKINKSHHYLSEYIYLNYLKKIKRVVDLDI